MRAGALRLLEGFDTDALIIPRLLRRDVVAPTARNNRHMPISPPSIAAVMVHVPDISQGHAWYEQAFPSARRRTVEPHHFEYLELGSTRIEVVQADDKVAAGPAGRRARLSRRP
jgi:hypothetical protein